MDTLEIFAVRNVEARAFSDILGLLASFSRVKVYRGQKTSGSNVFVLN